MFDFNLTLMAIWKIGLENMEFKAYHGWYEEERRLGNTFLVSVYLNAELPRFEEEERLEQTLNYEIIYQIVDEEMQKTRKLIETVVQSISERLVAQFGLQIHGEVKIQKRNPPLQGKVHSSQVSLHF
jgi:dihydroneopterin aldolase